MNKIIIILICIFNLLLFSEGAKKRFISIEWENIPEATEYILQISDTMKFKKIVHQVKTKDSLVKFDPNPIFKFGRIAAYDKNGIRGEFSDIFEIEQRIVEPVELVSLPTNLLGKNHSIKLEFKQDNIESAFYKLNENIWFTYNDSIQLTKEGLNEIYYYSIDKLGNKENIQKKEYILDTESPIIQVKFNDFLVEQNNYFFTNKKTKLQIKAFDKYSEVKTLKVFFNTKDKSTEMEIENDQILIPDSYDDKIVELAIYSEDRLENKGIEYRTFKHDITPPIIQFDTKTIFDKNSNYNVEIDIFTFDLTSGIESIYYSINSETFNKYTGKFLLNNEGEYTIKAYSIDKAGNKSIVLIEKIIIPKISKKNKG